MTTTDLYPSRVGAQARLLQRKDPVLHAGAAEGQGPLDRAALEHFEQNGFVVLDRAMREDEATGLRGEALRLRDAMAGSRAPELIGEPSEQGVRSIFAVHRLSTLFARLARDPRLLGAARQVLGSPVYIHQSRVNFKPAFRGREFYWHSDFETWHVEDGMPRMRALSISINLLENSAHNGPLMLIPGSHRSFVSCAGRTPERHYEQSLRSQEHGVPEPAILEELAEQNGIVAPVGPAGSMVLFDCNLMHGSNGNITPWPRSNLFLVYNSIENVLEDPFSGQPPRPEYIAHRDFAPLESAR